MHEGSGESEIARQEQFARVIELTRQMDGLQIRMESPREDVRESNRLQKEINEIKREYGITDQEVSAHFKAENDSRRESERPEKFQQVIELTRQMDGLNTRMRSMRSSRQDVPLEDVRESNRLQKEINEIKREYGFTDDEIIGYFNEHKS